MRAERLGRLAVRSILAAALSFALVAAPARAGTPAFGTPTADATYGERISFTVPLDGAEGVQGVELRLRFPDTIGPLVVEVPVPAGAGRQTLRYELAIDRAGHLTPNTTITATWVARRAAGDPATSEPVSVTYADTARDWRTVTGDLIRVHWYQGPDTFGRQALEIGERAVRDTGALLGTTETEPIDFFIYADEAAFREALGPATRENVGGQAHADIRTLFALIRPGEINDPWVGVVVPHELVHLVFDTAVRNAFRFPPRWLNEGLATYLSEGYTSSDRRLVQAAVAARDLMPLTALAGQFPAAADRTYLAYAESASAIDHLVSTHGRDAMVKLILGYRGGLTDDEAFGRGIGQDLAAFQSDWLRALGAEPPQAYGPRPAPPGPLPAGWAGGAAVPLPGASVAPAAPAAPAPAAPSSGGSSAPSALGVVLVAVFVAVVALAAGLVLRRRSARGGGPDQPS